MRIGVICGLFLFFVLFAGEGEATLLGGTAVTPSSYQVCIKKVEFEAKKGGYSTCVEGYFLYDIATATPLQAVGTLGRGCGITPGSYKGVRVTFSRTIGVATSGSDGGQALRTATGNGSNAVEGALSKLGEAAVDGGGSEVQQLCVPRGSAVTAALAAVGITEVGEDLQVYYPVVFTQREGYYVAPAMRVDFDIKESVEILSTGPGAGVVFPLPPRVSVTVTP